jgi:hypothetical protein
LQGNYGNRDKLCTIYIIFIFIFCDQKRPVNANYTNTPMASCEGNWMTIQKILGYFG